MSKLFSLLICLLMVIQIIRPFGWPGLRRRRDFWRLALVAMIVFGITTVIRP